MEYKAKINGLQVDAKYSLRSIEEISKPLINDLIALQKQKNRRIIVYISAPPAVGKSTLVSFLQDYASEQMNFDDIQGIGIDGFHFYNDYLEAHDLKKEKGSINTFNVGKLHEYIEKITTQDIIWPYYDRTLHNPQENGDLVCKNIILLEGNYLASSDERWTTLAKYCDYSIFLSAKEQDLRDRLINRKIQSGSLDYEQAVNFYEISDRVNILYVLNNKTKVDLTLELKGEEFYKN